MSPEAMMQTITTTSMAMGAERLLSRKAQLLRPPQRPVSSLLQRLLQWTISLLVRHVFRYSLAEHSTHALPRTPRIITYSSFNLTQVPDTGGLLLRIVLVKRAKRSCCWSAVDLRRPKRAVTSILLGPMDRRLLGLMSPDCSRVCSARRIRGGGVRISTSLLAVSSVVAGQSILREYSNNLQVPLGRH